MTRKDYVKFAALFAGEMAIARNMGNDAAVLQIRSIIASTADIFKQDNSRFDRDRFYAAAGYSTD